MQSSTRTTGGESYLSQNGHAFHAVQLSTSARITIFHFSAPGVSFVIAKIAAMLNRLPQPPPELKRLPIDGADLLPAGDQLASPVKILNPPTAPY